MRQRWQTCAHCAGPLEHAWQRYPEGIQRLHWCPRCDEAPADVLPDPSSGGPLRVHRDVTRSAGGALEQPGEVGEQESAMAL